MRFAVIFLVAAAGLSCETFTSPPSPTVTFKSLSVGAYHACALDDQQRAWCWGGNEYGEVGVPPQSCVIGNVKVTPCPQLMALIGADMHFTSISAGNQATCGVRTDGAGYCWGNDFRDLLGASPRPTTKCSISIPCSSAPLPVSGGFSFRQITVGQETTCGITTTGIGKCWGSTLGMNLNTYTTVATPLSITQTATGDSAWDWIGGGTSYNNCGVTPAHDVACWGENTYGARGNGGIVAGAGTYGMSVVAAPSPLHGLTLGDNFACALDAGGAAYCWGGSTIGALGVGTQGGTTCGYTSNSSCYPTPTAVKGGLAFATLSARANHVCGITLVGGDAYCWGKNTLGETGAVGSATVTQPTLVTGGLHFVSVSAGINATCGLTADGSIWCWGLNVAARPGDIYTFSPVPYRMLPPGYNR